MIKHVKGYQMVALDDGVTVWASENVWKRFTDVLLLVNHRNSNYEGKLVYGFREVVAYE